MHVHEVVSNGETVREEVEEEEEEDDNEEEEEGESMELQPLGRHGELLEADLQALETLEPDTSSQGSSGTMSAAERLEAAMSLSSLSVGLSVLEAGSSGEGRRDSPRGDEEPQAVGVLVIMPGAAAVEPPVHLHLAGIEHQDSGARSFESSMESESSRQPESLLLEADGASTGSQSQFLEGEGEEENMAGSTVLRTSSPAAAAASSGGNGSGSSSSSSSSSSLGQQQMPTGEATNGTQPQAEVSNNSSSSGPSPQRASTTGSTMCMYHNTDSN